MAVVDIRDPRLARKPVNEQLDKVAGGLDVTLSLLTARLGEVIKAQQDGNALLAVMARTVSDDETVGQGMGGVSPARPHAAISARRALLAATPSTRQGTRRAEPYSAGIDYMVDPGSGVEGLADQTRTGVRTGVAKWLTGRASYLADQYEVHPGEHIGKATGGMYRENPNVKMDVRGNFRNLTTGRYASAEDAIEHIMSGEERARLGAKLARSNVMSRVGEAWGQGETISRSLASALPQNALKFAGGAALGVAAASQLWGRAQDQYEQNRQFQEVYGGSNADQIGERASQWWNRNVTGRFSLLGGGNYDALFKGGMNMGLRGGDRSRYISTGADIMGTGVNAEQTKQIMDMSIQAGLGLSGLAKAIREVNDSARDAGVNAKHARDMFIANYTAGTELMFGSQNAKNFATSVTQGQLAQARPFQNINATGMMQSTPVQQMRASQLGMTLGEFEVSQTKSAGGSIAGNEQALKQMVDSAPNPEGKGKSVKQVVDEFIAQNHGYNAKYDQIALGEAMKENGWNEVFCHMLLARFGIDDGGQQFAPGYLANLYTADSAGSIALRNEAKTAIDFKPRTVGTVSSLTGGKTGGAAGAEAAALGLGIDQRGYAQAYAGSLTGGKPGSISGATYDPRVTELIKKIPEIGATGESKVRVQTADGPRIISLSDALRNFPDQVASSARFVSGVRDEFMDKTTGDITGAPSGGVTSSNKSISGYASQTDEQFTAEQDKKKKEDGKSSDQKIMLDLSPEAKRLLVPMMNGPYYATSAPTSGSGT